MKKFYLKRTGTKIDICSVGSFHPGVELEVLEHTHREFQGLDGWEGRIADDTPAVCKEVPITPVTDEAEGINKQLSSQRGGKR